MSRVLVIGDLISDDYRFCEATRVCPEAPVVALKEKERKMTPGGAGLVNDQLIELGVETDFVPVTISRKERIFADGQMVTRIDFDSESTPEKLVLPNSVKIDAVVVSDYGKGTVKHARSLMNHAAKQKVPVFVDAKNTWGAYSGAFAVFPNEREKPEGNFDHVIQKLGARGCKVDQNEIAQIHTHSVRDVCGAGDCFMAAFIAQYFKTAPQFRNAQYDLEECARYANLVAGLSVEWIGTHVVTQEEILDRKMI